MSGMNLPSELEARHKAPNHGDVLLNAADLVKVYDRLRELEDSSMVLSNGQRIESTMRIPVPQVAPFDIPITDPKAVQDVWDTFVKPDQDSGGPQSVEMRTLMAVLRSVYAGLEVRK